MKRSLFKFMAVSLLVSVFTAVTFCCCSARLLQMLHAAKTCSHCPKGTASHTADPFCLAKLPTADVTKVFSLASWQERFASVFPIILALFAVPFVVRFNSARLDGPPVLARIPLYIQSHNLRL